MINLSSSQLSQWNSKKKFTSILVLLPLHNGACENWKIVKNDIENKRVILFDNEYIQLFESKLENSSFEAHVYPKKSSDATVFNEYYPFDLGYNYIVVCGLPPQSYLFHPSRIQWCMLHETLVFQQHIFSLLNTLLEPQGCSSMIIYSQTNPKSRFLVTNTFTNIIKSSISNLLELSYSKTVSKKCGQLYTKGNLIFNTLRHFEDDSMYFTRKTEFLKKLSNSFPFQPLSVSLMFINLNDNSNIFLDGFSNLNQLNIQCFPHENVIYIHDITLINIFNTDSINNLLENIMESYQYLNPLLDYMVLLTCYLEPVDSSNPLSNKSRLLSFINLSGEYGTQLLQNHLVYSCQHINPNLETSSDFFNMAANSNIALKILDTFLQSRNLSFLTITESDKISSIPLNYKNQAFFYPQIISQIYHHLTPPVKKIVPRKKKKILCDKFIISTSPQTQDHLNSDEYITPQRFHKELKTMDKIKILNKSKNKYSDRSNPTTIIEKNQYSDYSNSLYSKSGAYDLTPKQKEYFENQHSTSFPNVDYHSSNKDSSLSHHQNNVLSDFLTPIKTLRFQRDIEKNLCRLDTVIKRIHEKKKKLKNLEDYSLIKKKILGLIQYNFYTINNHTIINNYHFCS